jgi:HEPN domain-containing protein
MKKTRIDLVYFEKTHNIEDLILLVSKKDETILDLKDIGTELTPYAIETRYPEFEEPALDDACNAVEIAEKFRDFIINRLSKGIEGEK